MNSWKPLALTIIVTLPACAPSPVAPPVVETVPQVRPTGYSDERWGQQLIASQGCINCHAQQPPSAVGPSLDSMLSGTRTFQDGATLELSGPEGPSYLAESITSPSARVVAGFQAIMPTYTLNDAQVTALLAYVRCFGEGACEQSPECAAVDACELR